MVHRNGRPIQDHWYSTKGNVMTVGSRRGSDVDSSAAVFVSALVSQLG
jgi:hypothetical protein